MPIAHHTALPTDLDAVSALTLMDAGALRDRLSRLGQDTALSNLEARAAVVDLLKAAEAESRDNARARLGAGVSGLAIARAMSLYRDTVIHCLTDFAQLRTGAALGPGSGFAVAAVGGYGRHTLAPYSDVDLLFIVPQADDRLTEQAVQVVLYALWDAGLVVGHATRTIDECMALAHADMSIRTNMLEARFLAGDRAAFDTMKARYWDEVASNVSDFVDAKLAEREERHSREGNSRYRVEPNVKDGKGGLRDLHTLIWIAKYVFRVDQPADLVDTGLLSPEEFNAYNRCVAFLWEVRTHLHLQAGRAEERLTFDAQAELARRLGYVDRGGVRAVEAFMKNYFLVAREVGSLTGIICTALEMQNAKGTPGRPWLRSRDAQDLVDWPGFVIDSGRVGLRDDGLFAADPVNILRLFEAADRTRCYIHPNALRVVRRSLHLITDDLRAQKEANTSFVRMLCEATDGERTLRAMNEADVLGLFVPEFGRVVAMMQFNMYHHFTVDEHLLRTVGEVDRVLNGSLKDDFPFADRVVRRLRSRRLLFMAAFLHDIAKGREEHHSIVGERIARSLCPRFGFSAAETDTVAWLVRQHLVLSDTSQRRDIYDPKTAHDVAELVQTLERLRLLFVLTVCDIRAVGPDVWNSWKGQLLESLFVEVEARLGGAPSIARGARVASMQEALTGTLGPESGGAAAQGRFDDAYWLSVPPEYHARHARLMRVAERRRHSGRPFLLVDARREADRAVTVVTVVAADRPGLFASLVGSLAASGAYIVGAKAFTTTDGIALDLFEIQDSEGTAYGGPNRFRRLRERILSVLDGSRAVESLLMARPLPDREQAFSVPPQVFFDNEASITHTVVEIEHRNRPELLYRVTAGLRDLGLSIGSAHCTSYGELAVGVFYLKDQGGLKILQPLLLDRIEARLLAALEGYS